jgi:hypothetical protein
MLSLFAAKDKWEQRFVKDARGRSSVALDYDAAAPIMAHSATTSRPCCLILDSSVL